MSSSVEWTTPVAPDGGYGWVVVAMACLANAIAVNGNTFFAILFVELPVALDQSQNAVGWISSIRQGVASLVGIAAGSLIDVYGCRTICIVGGILEATGYLLSSFFNNIYAMYLTYGLMSGVGFGMSFVASTVIVQQYFNRRRPFAAGLASAGIGVAGLLLAPCYQLLVSIYGWRGALLILSGITFNLVACGLAYIPLSTTIRSRNKAGSNRGCEIKEVKSRNSEIDQDVSNNVSQQANARIFPVSGSTIDERGQGLSENGGFQLDSQFTANQQPTAKSNSGHLIATICTSTINSRLLKNFRDTSLLREFDFILIALAVAMSTLWGCALFSMLYGYAIWKGASTTVASLMISVCSLSTVTSLLIASVVANQKCVNRSLLYSLALLYGGIVLVLSFVSGSSIYGFAVFVGLYGVSIGISQAVAVTNLSDLFGVHRVAKGYGWVQTLSALFGFTAMPIAGLIVDRTNNYDLVYAVIGIAFLLSGILAFVPFIRRFRQRNELNKR